MPVATNGLQTHRLSTEAYQHNFSDAHPLLSRAQALIEADRCYGCYAAPCIAACPTGIDIPAFIARIAQDNIRGAADTILSANILGGMCARVCPTEVLCEQACVRHGGEDKPVEIGRLQRYATDHYLAQPGKPLFTRATASGQRVAVLGAGPAGLSCAHRLAMLGHEVMLFETKPKPGGLNEYGLATYKTTDNFAQREIDWLLSIGGITVETGFALGRNAALANLIDDYAAVFIGLGLDGVNALGIASPPLPGVRDAVEFIAELRQAESPATVPIGRKVVVIGGGMTAIDAAVQSRLLGAEQVTIVYRRGSDAMSASGYEQDWAQHHGVNIRHWGTPQEILVNDHQVIGARFARTTMVDGRLQTTGESFVVDADMVLRAVGQTFGADPLGGLLTLDAGRIATDDAGRTSHPKVWAGGDCRAGGRDLTVEAVEHGKQAALSIDRVLRGDAA